MILKGKSSKLLQRQNFHFLMFKIQKQFCLKTKPLSLPSVLHFMQRILEYSCREEDLSKGQSKNIICLHFLQSDKRHRERQLAINRVYKLQHFTVHTQETKNNLWTSYFMTYDDTQILQILYRLPGLLK